MNLDRIEGTWYVIFTNFKMWLSGDKIRPTFTYMKEEKKGKFYLRDEVNYLHNGNIKSILGKDEPLDDENTKFRWQGNGLKSVLKSDWEIIYFDEKLDWFIIYFDKTLLTTEGYDVLVKNKIPTEEQISAIKSKLTELNLADELTSLLTSHQE